MRNLFAGLFFGLFTLGGPSAYAEEGEVILVEKIVPVLEVEVPAACSSEADCKVTARGIFPDSCYQLRGVKVIHVGQFLHEVTTYADVDNGLCLEVIIPFEQDAALGKLAEGVHKIRFLNGDRSFLEKDLPVTH